METIQQVMVTDQYEVELQPVEMETDSLGPAEVLIDTDYTVISAGTELANYAGKDPECWTEGGWCRYPWASGYGHVGRVRTVGAAVTAVKPGDRVFSFANHASAVRYDTKRLLVPVPEDIDPALAAASRMAGVSTAALVETDFSKDGWVVVFGLGMVGNLAAQSYRIRGYRVLGVDPVETRRRLAQDCGIEHTIGETGEDAIAAVKALTDGAPVRLAIESTGLSGVALDAIRCVADHGQLILLGSPRTPCETDVTPFLREVHLRWVQVRGALEWNLPHYSQHGAGWSLYEKQEMIFDWMRRDELRLDPLVSHRMPPRQVKEAYEGLLRQPETYTGVVLDWTQTV